MQVIKRKILKKKCFWCNVWLIIDLNYWREQSFSYGVNLRFIEITALVDSHGKWIWAKVAVIRFFTAVKFEEISASPISHKNWAGSSDGSKAQPSKRQNDAQVDTIYSKNNASWSEASIYRAISFHIMMDLGSNFTIERCRSTHLWPLKCSPQLAITSPDCNGGSATITVYSPIGCISER